MPKYSFACLACNTVFSKVLKSGEHPEYPCPECGDMADRAWEGASFGFDFKGGGSAPGNSGVTKHDYPTADIAVGRDADTQWGIHEERKAVKEKIRKEHGHNALSRRNVLSDGSRGVAYAFGGESVVESRRPLVREAEKHNWGVPPKEG